MVVQTKSLQEFIQDLKALLEKLQIQWQLMQGGFCFPRPKQCGGIWASAEEGCAGFLKAWLGSVLGSGLPEPGRSWWWPCLCSPSIHQAPHRLTSLTPTAQSLTRGRGRATLPTAPACLLSLFMLRRRCGHPFPQRGGTGMPHLQPDPGCCGLNQQRLALPCLWIL